MAAVICPKQDSSYFTQLHWPRSSLTVLLLASCCSNINCSSLLSRPLLFVIFRSLPRCCFSSPLGSFCLCIPAFYNECCCVCGIWEERDHEVLWGHLVSFSKLFFTGTALKKLAAGEQLLVWAAALTVLPVFWSGYQGVDHRIVKV